MTGYNCMKHAVEGVGFKEKQALTDKEQRVQSFGERQQEWEI